MKVFRICVLVVLAVAAFASHTVLFQQPVHNTSDLTKGIALQLGRWSMLESYPPSKTEVEGLETTDIIKRLYFDGTHVIELVVAHIPKSNRKSAHAQEACLRGGGALVSSISQQGLVNGSVDARKISMDIGAQKSEVFYWYKIGEDYTSDFLISSLKMYLGGLWGSESQGASLIRLLTRRGSVDTDASIASRIDSFAGYLIPELERVLP